MLEYKLQLLDGNTHGRARISTNDSDILVYRISKHKIKSSSSIDELNQSGVYILLGIDESSKKEAVYIGRASKRSSGCGVITRVSEHNNRTDGFNWHTALIVISKSNKLNLTEVAYLENFLYIVFARSQSFLIKNKTVPFTDILDLDIQVELSEFGKSVLKYIQILDYTSHFISTDYLLDEKEAEMERVYRDIEFNMMYEDY